MNGPWSECHINYRETRASISELNLKAAVQPEERGVGSRGRAGQTDRAFEPMYKNTASVLKHIIVNDLCVQKCIEWGSNCVTQEQNTEAEAGSRRNEEFISTQNDHLQAAESLFPEQSSG